MRFPLGLPPAALLFSAFALSGQTPGQPGAPPGSLTIAQAVAEAIQNNLDLLAERQNVPIARAREIHAALRPNPIVIFNWDYMDWLGRGLSAANSAGPSELAPQLNYIWETAGKRQKRIEVARLASGVAELRLLDSIRQLTFNVRAACVDYLLARENLALAQQNLKVFDDILAVNESRVKAGDLAGVELIRTRVAQQQFLSAVQQAQLRLDTARNSLQRLLGRQSRSPSFQLSGQLREDPAAYALDDLKSRALAQRPDLLALRKDRERASADTRLQQAIARPDLTSGLLYHHQYGYSNGRTFGITLSTELPIYERNQGEIARAVRETRQVELRAAALENSIQTEVENAWIEYRSAYALLERIRGSLLAEARRVRDITEFSYRRGEASLLEFLDAQRAFNDAMQGYNDARADYTRSLFLLEAAAGEPVQP